MQNTTKLLDSTVKKAIIKRYGKTFYRGLSVQLQSSGDMFKSPCTLVFKYQGKNHNGELIRLGFTVKAGAVVRFKDLDDGFIFEARGDK